MAERVVVGMSGGVDSSMAAYLLKEQGYEVIGVTMEMWRDAPEVCEDGIEAREISEKLGIEHYIMHFKEEFEREVVDHFVDEYLHGRTPNPCVLCNRKIKWEALMRCANDLGASYVATGHYARIVKLANGRYSVAYSASASKDQTYVLCQLTQDQLAHTLMPLGEYDKPKIREIAASLGLEVAGKKDSQDICFIDDDYGLFLAARLGGKLPPEGDFVLKDGTVVGRHKGIVHYTIGQRKGLGVALGRPVFVSRIDVEKNQVVLGEDGDVFSDSLTACGWNFISEEALGEEKEYVGKIRYAHKGSPCRVKRLGDDRYRVDFLEPVRAVTPGQTLVLYDGNLLAAGATIE